MRMEKYGAQQMQKSRVTMTSIFTIFILLLDSVLLPTFFWVPSD
jgi:hypothetical protein